MRNKILPLIIAVFFTTNFVFAQKCATYEGSLEEQKQFILEGFPGVGPTIAQELLKKYKTLKNIFKTREEELEEIKSFDKNKVENFKRLFES